MNKIIEQIKDAEKIINSIDFDAHWYRRVFHAFGASFLVYYIFPDVNWINLIKFWVLIGFIAIAIILEILRLNGKISSDHFFGLRFYEKNRVGSYLFFAVAALILLLFFPQKIAIPCILCACIADPVMGEVRYRFGDKLSYFVGFLTCMLFFGVVWYKSDPLILISIGVVGSFGAVVGEAKKFWWLDDDFMIQMVPAILLLIIWLALPYFGINMPQENIIYPGLMPW